MFQSMFVLVAFLISLSSFADPKQFHAEYVELNKLKQLSVLKGGAGFVSIPGVLDQKLDHFSSVDNRKFKQRFWYMKNHRKSKSGLNLLYICGEGKCGDHVFYSQISAHAFNLGAAVYVLEHRYYGESQPFSDLSTPNLKFLSTDQALEDLVFFKNEMVRQQKLTGPWIAVGGSYPGMLAADLRIHYPNQFVGALASSAPVRPSLNFVEFDHHIAKMVPAECISNIQNTLNQIEVSIESEQGFLDTKNKFSASQMNDRGDFLYLLSDVTAASIVYGKGDELCRTIAAEGVSGYVKMKMMVDQQIADYSIYSAEAAEDIQLNERNKGTAAMRQWFYQSCTEYGFWQNAWPNPAESARSHLINADYHDRLCQRLFGMEKVGSISRAEEKFYSPLLSNKVSQVLFTNGDSDPWMNLSISSLNGNLINPNIESLLMPKALHCDDLKRGGEATVMSAKKRFQDLARKWISAK